MTTYSLEELLNMGWRTLPQGDRATLTTKLETVDDFLDNSEVRIDVLQNTISTASLNEENSALFTEYQTLKLQRHKAFRVKKSLEREIARRGGAGDATV